MRRVQPTIQLSGTLISNYTHITTEQQPVDTGDG